MNRPHLPIYWSMCCNSAGEVSGWGTLSAFLQYEDIYTTVKTACDEMAPEGVVYFRECLWARLCQAAFTGPPCVLLPVRQPLPAHYGVMKCCLPGCPSFPPAASYGCVSFTWVGKVRIKAWGWAYNLKSHAYQTYRRIPVSSPQAFSMFSCSS